MKLEEVLPALREGKKIRRAIWRKFWMAKLWIDDKSSHWFDVKDAIADDWKVMTE